MNLIKTIKSLFKSKNSYEAAENGRRNTYTRGSSTSANTENRAALSILRGRSRDLVRNNPYASKAVSTIVSNVAGKGIKAIIKGTSEKKANILFKEWMKTCDYDERMDLYGLQGLILRAVAESGEALIVRVQTKTGLKLKVLEGDYIDTSKDGSNSKTSKNVQGIEFNKQGKRTGYWIYQNHPGDSNNWNANDSKLTSANQVIHVYVVDRPGQVRGVPWGVSGMTRLRGIDEFQDARVEQMKVAACFAGFIIEDENSSANGDILPEKLEPGIFPKLGYGQDIKFNSPPSVIGHEEFISTELHAVAASWGLSYEALTGDFSKVNFSSGRMGWIEFQRNIDRWQSLIIRAMDQVSQWYLLNLDLMNITHKNIYFEWTPPRREMIDPNKEIPALIKAVRAGFKPWQEVVRELGYDAETVAERIKEDNELFDKFGFIFDSDARNVTMSGQLQVEDDEIDSEE